MTRMKSLQAGLLLGALLAASGCGIFKKGTPSTPVLGERIDVLSTEGDITVDPAASAQPINLPDPVVNADWTQSGGTPTKSMGACDTTALDRNLELARRYKITGTPAVVFEDGTRAPGAIPADQIEKRLKDASKKS